MLDVLHNVELFKILYFKYLIAFITATGVSASLNFIGQKFWVFKTA
tara:strand:- start:538 stop:675 length:138 start_codon:yes stop_codon:yes gene_type:complete